MCHSHSRSHGTRFINLSAFAGRNLHDYIHLKIVAERMGLGESRLQIPGGGTQGFHVLSVIEGSPGHRAGLEAYFDFIVTINGIRLKTDTDQFKVIVNEHVNKSVELTIYNSKTHSVRQVSLIPHDKWGGEV
jgi:S1-C subfamily serine protease